jgi:hypothetical protein
MRQACLCAAAALLMLPGVVRAQIGFPGPGSRRTPEENVEPIETDRPDFTETARTVPPGRIQIEGGYTFAKVDDDEAQTVGELLLRIAMGARTELRVNFGSYALQRGPGGRASGFEDIEIGVKVELRSASREFGLGLPDMALIAQTTLPTGASAFRENTTQPEAKLALAWDLSPRVSLGSNLNFAYQSEQGERYTEPSGSVTVGYAITERTGAYLELFGFAPSGEARPNTSYADGGLTYLVNDDLQLDARAGVGLNSARPDLFFGLGASRRF